jgi:hypothetical protein
MLLIGLALVLPARVMLQQPAGQWSLFWDTMGLTLGLLGTGIALVGFGMAMWRLIRGE